MRSPIDGFVDAALFIGAIGVPQSAYVNNAGILWINRYTTDLACVLQADVIPGRAPINGFVDAVTGGEILANVTLAGSRINGFRIGGSDGQRADRSHRLAIKNRSPDNSGIGCFPNPA